MNTHPHFVNFSYRFASREPAYDVYPWKSRDRGGLPWEGFEKAAWLHHSTGTPVTWMIDSVALQQAGRRLRKFADVYGDDFVLYLEAFGHQPFYEKLGVKQQAFGLRNYSYDELCTLISGYRDLAAQTLGRDVTIGAGYWWDAKVLHAARDSGMEALWGLCWDQQGIDGATHRGSPWFPYYASPEDFKAPVASRDDGLLLMPWYRADLGNAFLYSDHPPFTTHSGELVRWNLNYPSSYVQAMINQGVAEAKTSPFAFTEFHLECDWFDSSGLFHDEEMSPATEVWNFQKTCVTEGLLPTQGQVCGLTDFVRWHLKHHSTTTRHELLWSDPFGDLPNLKFEADHQALTVSKTNGELVAQQPYEKGALGVASEGFRDRQAARKALHPGARLPTVLQRRLDMNMGRDEELLTTGVAHER